MVRNIFRRKDKKNSSKNGAVFECGIRMTIKPIFLKSYATVLNWRTEKSLQLFFTLRQLHIFIKISTEVSHFFLQLINK